MRKPDSSFWFSIDDLLPWARVSIDKRGCIVLPKEFRNKLDIKEGQAFEVTYKKGHLIFIPSNKKDGE